MHPAEPVVSRLMLLPGAVFAGRYRVVRHLGSGGMAEVFEVEHLVTTRHFALKTLRPETLANPANVKRFLREASVCANIDSDHIVSVIDCDTDDATGVPFLVMELLQGTDLAQYLRDTFGGGARIPPSLVLSMLRQVASALDKVHAQGIVHRDLKPANLFLTFPSDGPPRVKILDFGIAKIVQEDKLRVTRRLGTPLYMAPEQRVVGGPLSPATDIWALGLIAYELFTGVPYWDGLSAVQLFESIPRREAHVAPTVRAARLGLALEPAFDPWFLRCLDPDPRARPATAGAAVGELARIYDPTATQPPARLAAPATVEPVPAPRVSLESLDLARTPVLHASAATLAPGLPAGSATPEPVTPQSATPQRLTPVPAMPLPAPVLPAVVLSPSLADSCADTNEDRQPTQVVALARVQPLPPPPPMADVVVPVLAPLAVPAADEAPEPSVRPVVLVLAALVAGVLAAAAVFVVLRDRAPAASVTASGITVADPYWREPSGTEHDLLLAACRSFDRALVSRQRPDGSFAGVVPAAPSGWDTGQQLAALLAGGRACGMPAANAQLRALEALDRFRLSAGWAGTAGSGAEVRASTVATAWAVLAYSRLESLSHDPNARARVLAARQVLLAAPFPDGGFPFGLGPGAVREPSTLGTVMALWALTESEAVDPAPAVVATRRGASAWLRRVLRDREHPAPGMEVPLAAVPGLAEQALYVLWTARARWNDREPGDELLAAAFARDLLARCAPAPGPRGGCTRLRDDNGMVRQRLVAAAAPVPVVTVWFPWALLAGAAILQDDTVPLDAPARVALSAMVRWALAELEIARPAVAAEAPYKLADHLLAVSELLR